MKKHLEKYFIYYVSIIIFIISFVSSILIKTNEIFKGLISLPAIGSLISVLYKIWTDNLTHERNIELQNKQQDFILGTASHMAEVAYDKHVLFCEDYIDRIQKGLGEMLKDGPSKNTLEIGRDLVLIRQKHSTWLTKEIEESLKPYEQALIKIGAKEHYLENAKLPVGEERNKVVEEIFHAFGLVIGHDKPLNEEEGNTHSNEIIEKIRNILGINTLTKIRTETANLALKRLKK